MFITYEEMKHCMPTVCYLHMAFCINWKFLHKTVNCYLFTYS